LLSAALSALDLLKIGVAIATMDSRLLHMNQAAEEILSTRDGLEIASNGILQLSVEGGPLPVYSMLEENAALQMYRGGNEVTSSVHRPSGKQPLTVIIRPTSALLGWHDTENPAVLIFILDPERPVGAPQADLHQLYGLTSAESTLANCLMEGKTLNECSEFLGIRRSTARMHLRNLFSKTGTQRQSELVGLLFRNHGLVSTEFAPGRFFPELFTVPDTTLSPDKIGLLEE
jgi:DNA-binding CsgD family transcriptional regulator